MDEAFFTEWISTDFKGHQWFLITVAVPIAPAPLFKKTTRRVQKPKPSKDLDMPKRRRVSSYQSAQKIGGIALVVGVIITLVSGEWWHWIAILAALFCALFFRV